MTSRNFLIVSTIFTGHSIIESALCSYLGNIHWVGKLLNTALIRIDRNSSFVDGHNRSMIVHGYLTKRHECYTTT